MRFYTTQHKLASGTDITWAARHTFSPTYDLVRAYKAGEISWSEYREKYLHLLRVRYSKSPENFLSMVHANEKFACYCKPGENCHRYILASVLQKLKFEYGGEL